MRKLSLPYYVIFCVLMVNSISVQRISWNILHPAMALFNKDWYCKFKAFVSTNNSSVQKEIEGMSISDLCLVQSLMQMRSVTFSNLFILAAYLNTRCSMFFNSDWQKFLSFWRLFNGIWDGAMLNTQSNSELKYPPNVQHLNGPWIGLQIIPVPWSTVICQWREAISASAFG